MSVYRVIVMFEPGSPAPYDVDAVQVVGGADVTQILDENNDAVLTVPTAKLVSVERLPDTPPSRTVLPPRGRSAHRREPRAVRGAPEVFDAVVASDTTAQ